MPKLGLSKIRVQKKRTPDESATLPPPLGGSLLESVQATPASAYTYTLPPERIARHPVAPRDAARLLVSDGAQLLDTTFADLPQHLPPGALLLLNTTQVVPARLHATRATGAAVEVFCLAPADGATDAALAAPAPQVWQVLIGGGKRWKVGETLTLGGTELTLALTRLPTTATGPQVRLSWQPAELSFAEVLGQLGHVPLPPYLERPDTPADRTDYQTTYAQHPGSVAAPTAGLHLTPTLLARLAQAGHETAEVVLHVGAGTFQPLAAETLGGHTMHGEPFFVPAATLRQVADALATGRPVVPVGTTSLRTLESLYWLGLEGGSSLEQWAPYRHRPGPLPPPADVFAELARTHPEGLRALTQLVLAPGYPQWVASGLITNFHQPGSTLLLLVAALVGERWRQIYTHALAHGYRFLSYGDGSLLLR